MAAAADAVDILHHQTPQEEPEETAEADAVTVQEHLLAERRTMEEIPEVLVSVRAQLRLVVLAAAAVTAARVRQVSSLHLVTAARVVLA